MGRDSWRGRLGVRSRRRKRRQHIPHLAAGLRKRGFMAQSSSVPNPGSILHMATSAPTAPTTDAYLEKFKRFESAANQPKWLLPLRKAGLARFGELGLPTPNDEDWRFTNTAAIAKRPFNPLFDPADGVTPDALEQFAFAGQSGSRLVFVNGHFAAKLSSVQNLPAGVK